MPVTANFQIGEFIMITKKYGFITALPAVILAAVLLCGCGAAKQTEQLEDEPAVSADKQIEQLKDKPVENAVMQGAESVVNSSSSDSSDFSRLSADEKKIALKAAINQQIEKVTDILGQPDSETSVQSCLGDGDDVIWEYTAQGITVYFYREGERTSVTDIDMDGKTVRK